MPNYIPIKMSGGQPLLEGSAFPIGSRVRVVNDSPFRELKGTILAIHMIAAPGEPTFCFYLVALDGAYPRESIWFDSQEIVLVGTTCEKPAECEALKS